MDTLLVIIWTWSGKELLPYIHEGINKTFKCMDDKYNMTDIWRIVYVSTINTNIYYFINKNLL